MKKRIKEYGIYLLLFLLFLSYFLVIHRYTSDRVVTCNLKVEKENYQKEIEVKLYYQVDEVHKIKMMENFSSSQEDILTMKEEAYKKENYTVKKKKNSLIAEKEKKENTSYEEMIKDLLEAGYACK